jgi:RimJ/RimL family protein N-acetyltransferase
MDNAVRHYNAWIVKSKQENAMVGFVIHGNFFSGHPNNIGFNIGLNYTRQGYATESVGSLVNYLRSQGYTETFAHCFATNVPSIRCMEACGFINMGPTGRQYGANVEIELKKRIP